MRLRDVESCFLSPLCIAMVLFTTALHTPPSRAFLAGVHSCAGWARMQYSAPRFRGFLCSMHKNTRKKLRNYVQYFIKLWFLGFNHNMLWISTHFTLQKALNLVVSPNLQFGSIPAIIYLQAKNSAPQHPPRCIACAAPHTASRVPCQLHSRPVKAGQGETLRRRSHPGSLQACTAHTNRG